MSSTGDPALLPDADPQHDSVELQAERGLSLLLHRGPEVDNRTLWDLARQVFGGHLRPDARLGLLASAPVRILPGEGLDGTVRVLHLLAPSERGVFTALSPLVLPGRMGFGEHEQAGWAAFGDLPTEAFARRLSEETGPVAALSQRDGAEPLGCYSLFGSGRRVWSACYRPGAGYATWDGSEVLTQTLDAGDPAPPEGDYDEFPAHGLQLLFAGPLGLPPDQRLALLPSLRQACRPGQRGSEAWLLVEDGRFVPPGQPLDGDDVDELTASLWGRD